MPNAEALALAESFRAQFDGATAVVNRMPSIVERQILSARSEAIGKVLAPIAETHTAQVEAAAAIGGMLIGFGIARADKSPAETISVYVKHLGSLPLFAIKAACADITGGRVYDVDRRTGNRIPLDPDHPPSTIRVRSVAQKHVDELAAEKWKFDKVLAAKRAIETAPSPAARAVIARGFDELKAVLEQNSAKNSIEEEERAAARAVETAKNNERFILDQYATLGLEPIRNGAVLVSPELAKNTGGLHRAERTDAADRREHE